MFSRIGKQVILKRKQNLEKEKKNPHSAIWKESAKNDEGAGGRKGKKKIIPNG